MDLGEANYLVLTRFTEDVDRPQRTVVSSNAIAAIEEQSGFCVLYTLGGDQLPVRETIEDIIALFRRCMRGQLGGGLVSAKDDPR